MVAAVPQKPAFRSVVSISTDRQNNITALESVARVKRKEINQYKND